MVKIAVELKGVTDTHCGKCVKKWLDFNCENKCTAFAKAYAWGIKLKKDKNGKVLRCKKCLEAEIKED